ncbi:hypothetical protein SHIRM173S_03996 [Streptomyces hirsutus]
MTEAIPAYELAQVNISRLQAPLDSPQLKDFVDNIDSVNADAEAAEGFVWRLLSEKQVSPTCPSSTTRG